MLPPYYPPDAINLNKKNNNFQLVPVFELRTRVKMTTWLEVVSGAVVVTFFQE